MERKRALKLDNADKRRDRDMSNGMIREEMRSDKSNTDTLTTNVIEKNTYIIRMNYQVTSQENIKLSKNNRINEV